MFKCAGLDVSDFFKNDASKTSVLPVFIVRSVRGAKSTSRSAFDGN